MQLGRVFSSGQRVFAFLTLFAVAAVLGSYFWLRQPTPSQKRIAGAWGVEKSGSGLAVNWNFDAPLFRDARNVVLEIHDGSEEREIPLNRNEHAGTLYFTPQDSSVTLRLRIQKETGEPERTEVIRLGAETQEATAEPPKPVVEPAIEEGTRARLESPVSVWRVKAFAPPSLAHRLRKQLEVAVYVKIEPSGKVTAASTRKYDDPTESALANIATAAAMQWKFKPLKSRDRKSSPIYRDFVIHFKFPRA